ncbi:7325_t:CDS:1, partial [Entrophospora sp. SA101]
PENIFLKILKHYGIGETSVANVNVDDENLEDLKLFSFDLCIYQWILKNFKPYPTIISKCFVEISLTKSYVDSLVLAGNAASSSSTSKLPHSIYTSFIKTYCNYCNYHHANNVSIVNQSIFQEIFQKIFASFLRLLGFS